MNLEKRQRRLRALRNQIQRLDRRLSQLRRQSDHLTRWRLISFALTLLLGIALFLIWGALPWAVITLLLLIPFTLTVRWHRQIESSITRHLFLQHLKKIQLARLTLDWDNIPPAIPANAWSDHPFAHDLDLVGERSLSRLLDVSITREGSQRFCAWLLETEPNPERAMRRQATVRELMHLVAFRDRLVLNASLAGERSSPVHRSGKPSYSVQEQTWSKWSGHRLLEWLDTHLDARSLRNVLIPLLLLVPVNFLLLAGYLVGRLPPLWIGSWFVYAAIMLSQSRKLEPLFRDAAFLSDSLRQLVAVLSGLEKRPFNNKPALQEFCAPLRQNGRRPSEQLRRANRLLFAAGLRINPVIAFLLNAIFPWDMYIGYRLEIFKNDLADLLPGWLDLWFELEALNGLANFGNLYPEATFATITSLPTDESPIDGNGNQLFEEVALPFEAHDLCHPLIVAEERVGNYYAVHQLGTITIITGSNMAGKSSFLRTIGVNICLALAGAPVLASGLNLMPFRLAASITVTDSVTDGFSFFYAEVRRLKALLDELQQPHPYPLFFLIDEIFRGTNNRERLIGSRSYVQALLGGYGTGAIATHDLELVKLAEDHPNIQNAHFRDDVRGERMVFDYKLHPGPCPTTNALRIMRLAGLPIDQVTGEETIAS